MDFATFLAMGGRAAYVWPAYGLTVLMLLALLIHAIWRLRARTRELEHLEGGRRRDRRAR